jgi:hypothetical protein
VRAPGGRRIVEQHDSRSAGVIGCPRCGAGVVAGQEYCLECGARLPGPGAVGRTNDSDRARIVRVFVTLLVALSGAALAVAASEGGSEAARVTTATGGFATLPSSSTLPAPVDSPAGIVDWPAGEDGWTIALASLPQTGGRRAAAARARAALARGLSPVGILDSSQYASLHPGYWVVYTGTYTSEAEATSALQPARRFARTATVRRIVP